ncbi:hypothetical protein LINPERPRIM_LOCUS10901 [Linum perenne]
MVAIDTSLAIDDKQGHGSNPLLPSRLFNEGFFFGFVTV